MIFSDRLKNLYPFATRFFETALQVQDSRFAHAFMLCGLDIVSQYEMALSIAKHLNSSGNPQWVEANAHPAVITISPIDYTDKSRAVISVKQIRNLKNFLSMTSPYHRVVIFTDAKEMPSKLPFAVPKLPSQNDEQRDWTPFSLNSKVFSNSPANALLKILEEPPCNVTYFFLTKNKEDMLPTIVSRCQIMPVVAAARPAISVDLPPEILDNLLPKNEEAALLLVSKLLDSLKEQDIFCIIDALQENINQRLLANIDDKIAVQQFIEIIKKMEDSKSQLRSFVSPQNVLESLFLSFV